MEGASVKDYSANVTYYSRYNGAGLPLARGGTSQISGSSFMDIEFIGANQTVVEDIPGHIVEDWEDLTQWERDTLAWYWADSTYKTGGVGSKGKWIRLPPGQYIAIVFLHFYADLGAASRMACGLEQMTDGNTTPHPNGDDGYLWKNYYTETWIDNSATLTSDRNSISWTQMITQDCGSSRIYVPLCRNIGTVTTTSLKLSYIDIRTLD